MRICFLISVVVLQWMGVGAVVPSSFAASGMPKDIMTSGGITLPSYTTAVHTNPAGIATKTDAHLSLQTGADKMPSALDEIPVFRGQLGYGNGTFGLAAGVEHNVPATGSGTTQDAFYGLGLRISPLGLTLGLSGETPLEEGDSRYTAGLFFEPTSRIRLAAAAKNLEDVQEYGVGIGLELVSGFALVVDAAFDSQWKENQVKPGLVMSNRFAGISLSYGTGETSYFSDGFTAGVFMKAGTTSNLEFYYNQGAGFYEGYLAVTLGF